MIFRKKYTAAQLLMLKRIIAFAFNAGNTTITNSIAALLAAFTTLKGVVTSVDDMLAQYTKVITGWAEQKRLARLALANTTYTIVKAVRAYAIANNNWTLANEMKTSLSILKRTAYATLLEKVNGWINTVGPLVASLGDYGITTSLYNQWKTDRDALTALLTAPKEAIDAHTVLGSTIVSTMQDAMTLTKEQIDGIVANLMESQPGYYNGYHQSRKIDGPVSRHTTLDVIVLNELGQPVWNAIVTINEVTHTAKDGNTTTYKSIHTTTDPDGHAVINKFFACERTVTISGPGIITKTFGPFPFVHGKTIKQTLTVQPSFDNIPESKETTEPTETTATKTNS